MKSAIGVDIGGTNIKFVHISEKGEVLTSLTEPTPSGPRLSPDNIKNVLIKVLKSILKENIVGIGFGIAGLIDRKNGTVIESPNIPAFKRFPAKEIFEKEFSLPVVVENDANTYAYGEKWIGTGKNFNNFALLTLGTGIGGGMIYKGELFEGAVEVGHTVIEPQGRFCTCGSFGCLESYASGRAIVDIATSSLEKGTKSMLADCCDGNFYKITPSLVHETALDGDSLSREIFREVGRYLGIGIANLVNIFSPEAVILGGGLIGAWDMFIEELKKEVFKRAFAPLSANVEILKATLKGDGGATGAAGLVFKVTEQSTFLEKDTLRSSH